MEESLNFFRDNGYLVVADVLSPQELAGLNEAIDRDRQLYTAIVARTQGGRALPERFIFVEFTRF